MGKVGGFVVGAVLIGASFIPGLGAIAGIGLKSMLFSLGASTVLNSAAALLVDPGDQQRSLELNSANPQDPLPVVYGSRLLGLRMVDVRTSGNADDNKYLYLVGAVCHGSSDGTGIAGIDEIYFNDRRAIAANGTVESWLGNKVRCNKYLGTDAQQVDPLMNAAFPADWPVTSRGRGIAYIVLRLEFDAEIFSTGIPNVTCLVRGNKVRDPRNPNAAAVYRTNPSCCMLDYLTSLRYGARLVDEDIDLPAVALEAAHYDEQVPVPSGTQRRFELNGVLDVSQDHPANISQLLSSCRGNFVYEGGRYRWFTRRPTTPSTFRLSEATIVGGLSVRTLGARDCPNILRYAHIQPGAEQTTDGVTYAPSFAAETLYWPPPGAADDFVLEDNRFEVVQDIQLPCTHDPLMAQQIAMVTLQEQRGVGPGGALLVNCTAHEAALLLQVGDVVLLSHDSMGFDEKPFWVMGMGGGGVGLVELSLLEYNEAAYELDPQTPFPSRPATSLPAPWNVAPPTNLQLQSDASTSRRLVNGSAQAGIKVSITQSTHPYMSHYEVQARKVGVAGVLGTRYIPLRSLPKRYIARWDGVGSEVPWDDYGRMQREDRTFLVLPVGAYEIWEVRVRAINTMNRRSVWVQSTITIGADAPTPLPEGRNLLVNGNGEQGVVGQPAPGWTFGQGAQLVVSSDRVSVGTRSLMMAHAVATDSWTYQRVQLKAGSVYRLSAKISTTNLTGAGRGAALNVNPAAGQTLTVLERQGYSMGGSPEPDVGVASGAAADPAVFVQTIFTPNIDGLATFYLQLGYSGTLVGSAWFSDVKLEEIETNAAIGATRAYRQIANDGTMYVPDTTTIVVGEQGNQGAIRKTVRIPAAAFMPRDSDTEFQVGSFGSYITPHSTSQQFVVAAATVPYGVRIVEVRARLMRNTTNSSTVKAIVKVHRLDSDGVLNVTIATLTHNTTGSAAWQDLQDTSSIYVVGQGEALVVEAELNMNGFLPMDGARLAYVEIDFEMFTYAQTN